MNINNQAFKPPLLLRNRHAQSLLASVGLRSFFTRRRARAVLEASEEQTLHCSDGVRLRGFFSGPEQANGKLLIFIHGWLGRESSSYLLSAAAAVFAQGYSVFRLNLRDHGDTHHLNPELFHSARLQEVLEAVAEIQRLYPHQQYYLAGYSLGGNFALRVAARHKEQNAVLDGVLAVCPVIDPQNAMATISSAMWIYPFYFIGKWKRSLRKKLQHYPELGYNDALQAARTLDDMNAFFVPGHTPYETPSDYFKAYSVAGNALADLEVATHIIHAADDPVVSAHDLHKAASCDNLSVEVTRYGGHCGFLKNYRLHTWIDERLLEWLEQELA